MNVTNSTLSGNSATAGVVGGIYNLGTVNVTNSTLSGNSVTPGGLGGGIANFSTVNVKSSIIAGNTDAIGNPDVFGAFTSQGFNLIGKSDGSTGFTNGVNNDLVGTIATPLNPLLGPLASNGGPTMTLALLSGSSAIDQGMNTGLLTDQRGFARTADQPLIPNASDGTDIGAFELNQFISITADAASQAEGTGAGTTPFTFTVTRTGDTSSAVTVNYAVTGSGGNPANAADFGGTLPSGTFTIPAGQASATLTINVSKDNLVELNEDFTVTLSNQPAGYIITTATASSTITNDDFAMLSINNVTLAEGNSGTTSFVFTVSLSNPSVFPITVDYATANGTATAGSDYTATSGTLTFPANSTATQTITVLVNGDTTVEANETFLVNLTNPTNATISQAQGTGTITNDDNATIAITDVTQTEGNAGTTSFMSV